ncbi:hypothetical protein ACIHIX_29325 [Streptomyces sp. NPDC051913]|uniref:hypothetical protein n=1 Tax=Streptomyces sp. NPDC051913 TaxID=3365676 RepID=UPI0037D483E2
MALDPALRLDGAAAGRGRAHPRADPCRGPRRGGPGPLGARRVPPGRRALPPPPPGPRYEDLGEGVHYRYRYTGLRVLLERDHRYYLLRVGWDHDTDPTYVVEDDDTVRIELRPGVLPRTDR